MANDRKISDIVLEQRAFFNTQATHSYEFRIDQLRKLRNRIADFEHEIHAALQKDLGKSQFESYTSEVGFTLYELTHTIKNLKKWMRPRRVKTPLLNQPASSRVHYTPRGVNLIISPFNYPFGLTFTPLAAALAAGNTAVLKTSEFTPNTGEVIKQLVEETFDREHVAYISGGITETTQLLQQKFDHIFFTGSTRIGSVVMEAAARHLTPVTLELGGKSPCIVHADATLQVAVNRIVFGKFINAGQTCIAPDFVLVHQDIKQEFIEKTKQRIKECYGDDPSSSPDFGRVINERHFDRLLNLIDPDKVVAGGDSDRAGKYISPTVMTDISLNDKVMQEEIFGPILPVIEYRSMDELLAVLAELPEHPLACYIFSNSKSVQDELIAKVQFGGGCINHCALHFINPHLPFGGHGKSGMGSYHGYNGFECFSHKKSVLKAATWIDLSLGYPPYKNKLRLLRKIMK